MVDLPEWMTPDQVTLHRYEGAGVKGAVHGPPVESRARVELVQQYTRDRTGARVLCVARVWLPLDVWPVPPESRMDIPSHDKTATVVTAKRHEFSQATPNHVEVMVR